MEPQGSSGQGFGCYSYSYRYRYSCRYVYGVVEETEYITNSLQVRKMPYELGLGLGLGLGLPVRVKVGVRVWVRVWVRIRVRQPAPRWGLPTPAQVAGCLAAGALKGHVSCPYPLWRSALCQEGGRVRVRGRGSFPHHTHMHARQGCQACV